MNSGVFVSWRFFLKLQRKRYGLVDPVLLHHLHKEKSNTHYREDCSKNLFNRHFFLK